MTTVIGVRFREVGKIYYFAPGDLNIHIGDHVIVDTAQGTEYGTVVLANKQIEDEEVVKPLKAVRRLATKDDTARVEANREKEVDALMLCKKKVVEHQMDMKVIAAEYAYDNSKIIFFFTADGRIDFRDLVKDLASALKIRIELRQVGVRDETKLVGGMGSCGRPLCCHTFLSDFGPVSIRMAKEQNLSLNPQKISGVCGRLMCCLQNEADTYKYLNSKLPRKDDGVKTPDGREGVVADLNVLRQKVKVMFIDKDGVRQFEEFPVEELQITSKKKGKPQPKADEKVVKEVKEVKEAKEPVKAKDSDKPKKPFKNKKFFHKKNKKAQGEAKPQTPAQ